MTGNATSWNRILNHSSLNRGAADLHSVRLNADIVPTLQHIEIATFQRRVTVADIAAICSRRIPTHTDGGRQ